jgi:hypothetical protein
MTQSRTSSDNSLAEFVSAMLELALHPLSPFIVLTLCGVSHILASVLQAPELGGWFIIGMLAFDYARGNFCAAIGLAVFVLAALPLAWIAYREQQILLSTTVKAWLIAGAITALAVWLHRSWPYNGSGWQVLAFDVLLFAAWAAIVEASFATLAVVAHIRASRPPKQKLPDQQPHGRRSNRRPRSEPETI